MAPNSYTIYRKAPSDTNWGAGINLPGTTTSYVDKNVTVGTAYEYQIVKTTSLYTGYGYLYSGINVPLTDYRGKLLLVVDNTYAAQLTNELARLQQDLNGDGWTVIRLDVNRNDSVVNVKNLIKAQYTADPTNVQCVFLFGHVPVPYSGNIVPDGHTPDHQGAWPCDGFYGDMDGTWTDNSVNVTGQYDPRNTNVPGDGKYDQNTFPAPIKLMVGRVDLANMPGVLYYGGPSTFPSELDLLRNYLNKDHAFRTKQFDLPRRGIVGDFFGVRSGEAFAASGWRNLSGFFGASNITSTPNMGTWTPTLHTNAYLWAYGCGAGSFTSIAGLGNSDTYNDVLTREMWTNDIQSVFTLLFGSWLGDWDSQDNIMRGVLALPSYGLTCAWSGRPHWFMQHMALGTPIGYSARLTQNNGPTGLYQNEVNSAAGGIHIALMGDPTLRMHVVAPPTNLAAQTNGSNISLQWNASADTVLGYHVYRADGTNGTFTRLTSTPVTGTNFTDSGVLNAGNYMVRAVKLETSASGTYYNASQGAFLSPTGASVGYLGSTGSTNPAVTVSPTGTTSNAVTKATDISTNVVAWVDDSLPAGAVAGTDGGDAWNWVGSNPAPYSGTLANQSTLIAGLHQHFFTGAQALRVNTGDVLFAWVYLDPANLPSEIMLQWNDGSSWEHRAYWGGNSITYGTDGTAGRVYMGSLPTAGQWVLLQIPASQIGLEGSAVSGMSFSQVDGRVTWDYAGKSVGAFSATSSITNLTGVDGVVTNLTGITTTGSNTGTNTVSGAPRTTSTGTTTSTGSTTTQSGNTTNPSNSGSASTNSIPGVSSVDYVTPALPNVGDNALHVLTPTVVELKLIDTKQPDPAQVAQWNFVDATGQLAAPATSAFAVTADGVALSVIGVGFKRRPLWAPIASYDLRIENSLYLQLASPISDNQTIEVKNPDGTLWSSSVKFVASANPLRYSPAVHVNQEGYIPNYSKKAMVGYYLGSLGELSIPASAGFKLVDANTGSAVYQGTLTQRSDVGYTYTPTPYQQVYEADFSGFNTPGEYRLVVPGMGGSLPFMIDNGIAMDFTRAYAMGLYHQRCGTNTAMPYTRWTHDICHAAPASVPASATDYPFTWTTVAGYANTLNPNNPAQIAAALTSPAAQLFPFVNQGPVDVSGGHHDAGDYSKYTINSASLVAYLTFAVDSLPGVAALDNLGIPESGDGISDVMQEAKWEADFLAKMQDSDGGFYFLVYPQNREYENNVTPEHGDPQVVWPKTTSVTAASVAALAELATSPLFKKAYPAAAATYMQKAQLGWQFLMNAINKYGKNGAYQKITHYGDNFADNDEMAWAACQMYLATGDSSIHQMLLSWFDPSDPATWRWGWWHMSECYGHTIRSYAFAVQSGRATASQLDPTFLSKCQQQIAAGADDMLNFSQQNAYGSSLPSESKSVQSAGWYFSCDQAFDMAVAYQLNPKPAYLSAMLQNMNYEGGCNPVNVSYVTGLGWRRQRDIVSNWAVNDSRVMPPSGIPVGNIVGTFGYLWDYGSELENLCFPSDGATTSPYPFYDRWGDSWNVNSEMVVLNQARGLGTLAFLAAQTGYTNQAWKAPANASITVPSGTVPVGTNVVLSMVVPGMDLSGARITWEGSNLQVAYGQTFNYVPQNNGTQWVEAEAQWPDGRRAFARGTFAVNSPNVVWVDDNLPAGATPGSDGGDSWNWVSANPAPCLGSLANQSAIASGEHQHFFTGATATLSVGTGDVLYASVYLDPANMPSELMLQWSDGTWDHRAYWGADNLSYGTPGTPGRVYMGALPTGGQWVQLQVPANKVNLEGSTLSGMAFTLFDGRATWDAAGRQTSTTTPTTNLPFSLKVKGQSKTLSWTSSPGTTYQISTKDSLVATAWTPQAQVTATGTTTTWTDNTSSTASQRFYSLTKAN